jgi:uncharacterized protein YheU (UPF0270 family)
MRNMVIPVSQLQEETLNKILEEFITREETDYGDYEIKQTELRNSRWPRPTENCIHLTNQ